MIQELGKGKARLIVNVGSGAGRRRFTKTVTYSGKKELKSLYEAFEAECADKDPSSKMTIGELLDDHIEYIQSLGRKPTTVHGYRVVVKRFSARFKSISAEKCTAYQIEKEIALMSNNGLSAKSIKNSFGLLSAAYTHAVKTKQLKENPCEYATLPKVKQAEKRTFTKAEIQKFLHCIADRDINEKVAYELALFCGLRRSEILGLKESDVDIVRRFVSVHNTRHRVDGTDYDSDTKTEKSTRILALPDILVMDIGILLQAHKQMKFNDCDYLIQDGFGNPLGGQALSSRLKRLEVANGLPLVSLHGLRHTYATLLNAKGVDMARISAELGHSNQTTTANIYTHVFGNVTESSRGIAGVINEFNGSLTKAKRAKTSLKTGVFRRPPATRIRKKCKNSATFLPHTGK